MIPSLGNLCKVCSFLLGYFEVLCIQINGPKRRLAWISNSCSVEDDPQTVFVFTLTCQSGFSYSNRIPYLELPHLTFNDGLISGWAKLLRALGFGGVLFDIDSTA